MINDVPKKNDTPKSEADLQTRLGLVVRTHRRQLGLTQDELAWRSNMHRTYIADIERGARNVTLRSIVNFAKALQITVGSLVSFASATGVGAANAEAGDILLVEDSATDAALAERALARARVANPLRIVRDAEEGLEFLFGAGRYASPRPARPRLILLDLNLPGMSGLDFLRRIKQEPPTREIPVVALTASKNDRMIVECGRLGVLNYIVKPLDIENIVRVTPRLNLQLTLGSPDVPGLPMAD